jgi:hypothetical protein
MKDGIMRMLFRIKILINDFFKGKSSWYLNMFGIGCRFNYLINI